ncbi:hypothetical protein D3C72_1677930 [compost metagenome]
MVAAPFPGAPQKRACDAGGTQVAGQIVVEREGGGQLRLFQASLADGKAAHHLAQGIVSGARGPGSVTTVAAHRNIDDPRPQFRQRLGGEPPRIERARPPGMRKHIRLGDERTEPVQFAGRVEIDEG